MIRVGGGASPAGWIAALAAALLIATALPRDAAEMQQLPVDGVTDWQGARAFVAGRDPYSAAGLTAAHLTTYGHPPTSVVWFLPFADGDEHRMNLALGVATVLMLLVLLFAAARELALPYASHVAALAFGLMLWSVGIHSHLHAGQVSVLIALLYVIAWSLSRRGADAEAGVFLGLACTLKLFPGVVLVLFLLRRRWWALVGAAASYLTIAALVTWRFGLACWAEFAELQRPVADKWMGKIQNASLFGILLRLWNPACGDVVSPTRRLATVGVALVGCALIVLHWRASRRSVRDTLEHDLSFAYFSVLSIFLNPWVWDHYSVFYCLPLLVLASALVALRGQLGRAALAYAAGGLAAAGLMALDTSIPRMWELQKAYKATHAASAHWLLHAYEIGNWLPEVLLLGLIAGLAYHRARRAATVAATSLGD